MQKHLKFPLSTILLALVSCDQSSDSRQKVGWSPEQHIDIELESEGMITVRHPGDVPAVTLLWEEDAIVVNQNLGGDGAPINMSGNIVRVWLKGQKDGRIWVKRNNSDEELVSSGGDSSHYEDYDGDGVVDYKRNGDGVFRVAEIVWEKIGDIPDVPPEAPNRRIDTHKGLTEAQLDP